MPDGVDDLIAQLTELRRGAGLTVQSIANAPAVLAALGSPPPAEALRRLTSLVRDLGDSEAALVLRLAYAIDVSPAGVLTRRRRDYEEATHRDKKTIIRYEDRMIRELAVLLSKGSGQRERMMVGAWVKDRALTLARVDFADELVVVPPNIETSYRPSAPAESLPLFLYRLPGNYAPQHLVISILFQGDQPSEIWGIHTPDVFEISTTRYERRIIHDDEGKWGWRYLDFDRPVTGYYYGFGWRY